MTSTHIIAAERNARPTAGAQQVLRRCGGTRCPPGTCSHDDEPSLQRSPRRPGAVATHAPPIVHQVVRSPGRPLEAATRWYMEPQFGRDFSEVRVHTDALAATSADSVQARAYTLGRDIAFAAGAYAPETAEGRQLIAHELAHVVQHDYLAQPTAAGSIEVGGTDEPAERDAVQAATAVLAGRQAKVATTTSRHRMRRLGANPGCTPAQAALIHQAIFDARGWLDKATTKMAATPLAPATSASLLRNFGPTYGVAVNAKLIHDRLVAARRAIGTLRITCVTAADPTCAAGHCGVTVVGSGAPGICANVTLIAGTTPLWRAGCALHETFHAHFAGMTAAHDFYSGWHGNAGATPRYPGAGIDPLLNADAYTTLVMDLS